MPNFALSRLERLYAQIETTYGTIPNTAGAATVGNSNALRFIQASFNNQAALIRRPDKTGTRSQLVGVLGRKSSQWSASMSLAPSGTAGTAPDADPFFQGVFGQAGTSVASTSYTYSLSDSIPSLSIWSFRSPSTIDQQVSLGSVVQEMVIEAGQDVAQVSFSGESLWGLQSNQFSVADLTQKGGLTSFPTEPSAPVTNGNMVIGFTGSIVIHSNTIATIRTATVRLNTGNVTIKDAFGTFYPTSAEGDERSATIDMSIYEDDSSNYQDLIAISQAKTAVTIVLTIGTIAGSIATITMNNVQLAAPSKEEQRRFIRNWSGSLAHASSLTSKNEMTLVFT